MRLCARWQLCQLARTWAHALVQVDPVQRDAALRASRGCVAVPIGKLSALPGQARTDRLRGGLSLRAICRQAAVPSAACLGHRPSRASLPICKLVMRTRGGFANWLKASSTLGGSKLLTSEPVDWSALGWLCLHLPIGKAGQMSWACQLASFVSDHHVSVWRYAVAACQRDPAQACQLAASALSSGDLASVNLHGLANWPAGHWTRPSLPIGILRPKLSLANWQALSPPAVFPSRLVQLCSGELANKDLLRLANWQAFEGLRSRAPSQAPEGRVTSVDLAARIAPPFRHAKSCAANSG
jgi:hypothetical protein